MKLTNLEHKNLLNFDFGNKQSQSTARQLQITQGEKRLAWEFT
jgi:hypothetical protein